MVRLRTIRATVRVMVREKERGTVSAIWAAQLGQTKPLGQGNPPSKGNVLSLLPVVVDVLYVVVVLQQVDELGHILDVLLIGEGDIVLGHHLDGRL